MADAILYEGYLQSLFSLVADGKGDIQRCSAAVENAKRWVLSLCDNLVLSLNKQIYNTNALKQKCERLENRAAAKAQAARAAIQPLPPLPVVPTMEETKRNPASQSVYEAQRHLYETVLRRNQENAARAAAKEAQIKELKDYHATIEKKHLEAVQMLARVQAIKAGFSGDLSYLRATENRYTRFMEAMKKSIAAADLVLNCNCNNLYNSFLKFDVPLPYETSKLSSRFSAGRNYPHVSYGPHFEGYSAPTPMPDFNSLSKTSSDSDQRRLEDVGSPMTEVTILESTVTAFMNALEKYPHAQTVLTTAYHLKSCGKKALIQRMESKGFTFEENSNIPKFVK